MFLWTSKPLCNVHIIFACVCHSWTPRFGLNDLSRAGALGAHKHLRCKPVAFSIEQAFAATVLHTVLSLSQYLHMPSHGAQLPFPSVGAGFRHN